MGHLHGVSSATPGGLTVAAVRTSVGLSLFFLAVYGGCNWLTAQCTDVSTWYFAWERHIPFVPLLIVPYMSIDLLFVVASFLCRDRQERRLFARRIVLAILLAGLCFLLFPLRFAFERPPAEGWLGTIFDVFRTLDQPYNLFPSLHITLRSILADLYAQYTRGIVYGLAQAWFSLIGFSTVLTYQHHIVDVLGGFLLAAICFYVWCDTPFRLPVVTNARPGLYYGCGALLLGSVAWLTWPWGGLLAWPALSCGLLTTAYYGVGPGIFRKQAGAMPLSARLLLGPVLLGQYLSLLYYRRQCRPWDKVVPGVLIGRKLSDAEAAEGIHQGITAVLDLTAEFAEARPLLNTTYCHLPVLDLTAPTLAYLHEAARFIAAQAAQGTVYVHCKIGYSRSAAAVGAYLLASGQATTVADIVTRLQQVRPSIVIRPEARQALQSFAQQVTSPSS